MITDDFLTFMEKAVRLVFLDHINQDEEDMTLYACDLATELAESRKLLVGVSLRIGSDYEGELEIALLEGAIRHAVIGVLERVH